MATPPAAPRRPTTLVAHGDVRVDEWYWLRERDDPEVRAYLEAENAHAEAVLGHLAGRREELFEEIRARIQETDLSAPVGKGGWWYYSRTEEGRQYAIHCRRRGSMEAAEEVMVDENVLAEGHAFLALGAFSVSPGHRLVAYSTDTEGDEVYTLRVRDLASGEDLADAIPGTYYGVAWANDEEHLFYTTVNQSLRPWRLHRHRLGTPVEQDVVVHQEDDEAFFVGVGRTKTEAFIVLSLASKVTSEARYLRADDPLGTFGVVEPRRQGVEYDIDHHVVPGGPDRFLIVTNDDAPNFKLVEAPVATPGKDNWRDLVAHRPDVRLEGVEVFAGHLVLEERSQAVVSLRVLSLAGGGEHVVDQSEAVYAAGVGPNPEFDSATLRFHYTSLVTPGSVFDYDMDARSRQLVKQTPVLGGYDPSAYQTRRLWATAPDGVQVPISVLWRRGTPTDGSAPALLYGYGSYEISIDPTFSSVRLSLVDRGFVFAIAHVRGGGEMGRQWYEDGKLLRKRNTFTDFVACARHLVAEGWTSPGRLVARGGSAGGLLMGAVANMAPELFCAVVAEVPFVDCLTTILDESLPLTVVEWEEWGNPVDDPEVYAYMRSYSPYDNVEAKDYPAMLVRAGLNDPRVAYWEPAKWVAKLRALRTDANLLVLKTDMGAGHGGPSGRYEAWRDEAFALAFIIDAVAPGGAES